MSLCRCSAPYVARTAHTMLGISLRKGTRSSFLTTSTRHTSLVSLAVLMSSAQTVGRGQQASIGLPFCPCRAGVLHTTSRQPVYCVQLRSPGTETQRGRGCSLQASGPDCQASKMYTKGMQHHLQCGCTQNTWKPESDPEACKHNSDTSKSSEKGAEGRIHKGEDNLHFLSRSLDAILHG
jgi:hypothetical protein